MVMMMVVAITVVVLGGSRDGFCWVAMTVLLMVVVVLCW